MGQERRPRKADNEALRREVETLRRQGEPLNREDIAARHNVGVGTVQVVRSEIDAMLAAEAGTAAVNGADPLAVVRAGGRTVQEFDGRKLLAERKRRMLMQDELAELASISRGEIGHLERCRRKPTLRTLRRLAEALNIESDSIAATLLTTEGEDSNHGRDHGR